MIARTQIYPLTLIKILNEHWELYDMFRYMYKWSIWISQPAVSQILPTVPIQNQCKSKQNYQNSLFYDFTVKDLPGSVYESGFFENKAGSL